jgi:hypothetical protein
MSTISILELENRYRNDPTFRAEVARMRVLLEELVPSFSPSELRDVSLVAAIQQIANDVSTLSQSDIERIQRAYYIAKNFDTR